MKLLLLLLVLGTVYADYTIKSCTETSCILVLRKAPHVYGADIQYISMNIVKNSDYVHVVLRDANATRFEVPVPTYEYSNGKPKYTFTTSAPGESFGFKVVRSSDSAVLFNTMPSSGLSPLIFEDQYITFATEIARDKPNIYGLGEHVHDFRLDENNKNYTLFAQDHAGTVEDAALYGTHPFWLEMKKGGASHGVFIKNANAMSFNIKPGVMTYTTIGGIIDLYVFVGPTPYDVVKQYRTLLGNAPLPALWNLGFHQCRWGYRSLDEVQSVVQGYRDFNLPLDVMWMDIDYMDKYKDFTFDPVMYPHDRVRQFIKDLAAVNQRLVTIVDCGIFKEDNYDAWDKGLQYNVFMKDESGQQPELGVVWPGTCAFPDFSHVNATAYWTEQLKGFFDEFGQIAGIWIDMNEAANFEDGHPNGCGNNKYDHPPYNPISDELYSKTLCMSAQVGGTVNYNMHSLYGHFESVATRAALLKLRPRQRPFVLSRSQYSGSGHHAAHWLGDNHSTFKDMFYGVTGMMNYQMFGIPLVGADICGFEGDTWEELCSRWHQVGAFHPFSRNHNALGQMSQEPWMFSDRHIGIVRKYLNIRYSLLPMWYTAMVNSSFTNDMVINPVPFEFYTDSEPALPYIDRQFLFAHSLMVSPVLDEGATTKSSYFPCSEKWYDYYTLEPTPCGWQTLSAPIEVMPIHIRGGKVISHYKPGLTTDETVKNPMYLYIALDKNGQAAGDLYLDDGVSPDVGQAFTYIRWTASTTEIRSIVDHSGYPATNKFSNIILLGTTSAAKSVIIDGISVPFTNNGGKISVDLTSTQLSVVRNFKITIQY